MQVMRCRGQTTAGSRPLALIIVVNFTTQGQLSRDGLRSNRIRILNEDIIVDIRGFDAKEFTIAGQSLYARLI